MIQMRAPFVVVSTVSLLVSACGGSSSGGRVTGDATSATDATSSGDATSTSTGTGATDATGTPDIVRLDTTTGGDTSTGVCEGVTLAGDLVWYEESAPEEDYVAYTLGGAQDLGFGGALPDILWIEFYAEVDQTGTWDLASADENDNYATCLQCVTVLVDVDEEAQEYASDLYQASGTLTVAAGSAPATQSVTVTLTNLKLVEVTIDEEEFTSTPVAGGACYDVGSPVTLSTE